MSALPEYAAWCATGLLICLGLLLLRGVLAALLRLLLRSALALGALALFSRFGHLIGVTLGVNPVNALVLGALGVPGFALLLLLQWAIR